MMNNISFQGRSDLIFSEKTYNKLLEECAHYRRVGSNRTFSEHKVFPHKGYSENLDNGDMVVIVRNENECFLQKFPIKCKVKYIADQISEKVEHLRAKSQEKLTAWILGGKPYDCDGGATIEAVNDIGKVLCDKPYIDTSILTGPRLQTENIVGIRDMADGIRIYMPTENLAIKAEHELENFFDIVELNNVKTEIL